MARIVRETVTDKFNKFVIFSILVAVLIGATGIVMFFLPDVTLKLIGVIIGILFLVNGANTIYKYFSRNGAKLYSLNLLFGLLIFLIGLVIILVPFSVVNFITVCFGLYLIIAGANKITYGVWFKIGNDVSWLFTMTVGISFIILGLLILFNPFASLTITQIVGVFLILASILEITNCVMLKKRCGEIVKIFW